VRRLRACVSHPISTRPVTQYIITRADLPKGFLAAQVAHAAGSYGRHPEGTYVVVLGVEDQAALEALGSELERSGVGITRVHEPDAPWNGQLTAIGCELVTDRATVRKVVSSIPLLK
jgi:hypothetical protein